MNLISGRLTAGDRGHRFEGPIAVDLDGLGPFNLADDEITLGIRPERVELTEPADPAALPGRVELIEAVGSDSFLSVVVADGVSVTTRVPGDTRVREGDCLHLRFPLGQLLMFNSSGNRIALEETRS
jgi:ABC-type sugar transport system ATPase subunit